MYKNICEYMRKAIGWNKKRPVKTDLLYRTMRTSGAFGKFLICTRFVNSLVE